MQNPSGICALLLGAPLWASNPIFSEIGWRKMRNALAAITPFSLNYSGHLYGSRTGAPLWAPTPILKKIGLQ